MGRKESNETNKIIAHENEEKYNKICPLLQLLLKASQV